MERKKMITTEKPYAVGLTMKEAMNAALILSLELVGTETAIAYAKTESFQPDFNEKKWAVVVTKDYDRNSWRVAEDMRYDSGHAHPDNPWQVHYKAYKNPYTTP